MRSKVQLASLALAIVLAWLVRGEALLAGFLLGVASSLVVLLLDSLVDNLRYVELRVRTFLRPNELVRVSISYVFRLRADSRYMLIRGSRFPDQFQPVGGVYKAFSSARARLSQLGVVDDNLVPIDRTSKRDLRVRVPARNLVGLVRWFESETDREASPAREFHEELIGSRLVDGDVFPYVMPSRVRRHFERLRFSSYAKSSELLIADVFEIELSQRQVAELERAVSAHPDRLIWATADQIERNGAIPGQAFKHTIAMPARWIL